MPFTGGEIRYLVVRNLSGCWIGQSLQDEALADQSMLGRSLEGGRTIIHLQTNG
jgi:hypothetical protein